MKATNYSQAKLIERYITRNHDTLMEVARAVRHKKISKLEAEKGAAAFEKLYERCFNEEKKIFSIDKLLSYLEDQVRKHPTDFVMLFRRILLAR